MAEVLKIVPYVLAFVVRDNKVLLSLRSSSVSYSAQYARIGRKIDGNESPTEALIREVYEEVGCTLSGALGVNQVLYFKGHKETCVAFTFNVTTWQGEPYNKEPEKHEHIKWFDLDDLPENILVRHKYIIACIRDGVSYAEWGFEKG